MCTPPRGGPLPRAPFSRNVYSPARRAPPQQHVGVEYPFRKLQAPNSRNVYSPARRDPQQHAWEYLFRKLQAPNSQKCVLPRAAGPSPAARVGVPFSQAPGPKLPNCILPRGASFPRSSKMCCSFGTSGLPRTEPQEPSEKPNTINLNRLFQNRNRTETNRHIHALWNSSSQRRCGSHGQAAATLPRDILHKLVTDAVQGNMSAVSAHLNLA